MNYFKFRSFKFSIFINFLTALLTVLSMDAISRLVVKDFFELRRNIFICLGIFICLAIFYYLQKVLNETFRFNAVRQLDSITTQKYLKKSFRDIKTEGTGQILSFYFELNSYLVNCTGEVLDRSIFGFFILLLTSGYIFTINPILIFIFIICFVASGIIISLYRKKMDEIRATTNEYDQKGTDLILENISGVMEYKTSNVFERYITKMDSGITYLCKSLFKTRVLNSTLNFITTITSDISTLVVLSFASFLVLNSKLESRYLISLIALLPISLNQSILLFRNYTIYKSGMVRFKTYYSDEEIFYEDHFTKPVFKAVEKNDFVSNALNNEEVKEIETKDLVIKYENKEIKIKDIKIEPGKKYAIVGESGCGKSSLIKTILGIHDNYEGKILINGKEKEKTKPLYDQIAYVGQETTLFRGSVEENIKLGNEKANAEELLQKVGLETIKKEEELIEGSTNISGGQKQRIGIARALAREKNIIFLDEVTSSLDKQSAEKIEEIMLNSDKTVVMITHKLPEKYYNLLDEVIELK